MAKKANDSLYTHECFIRVYTQFSEAFPKKIKNKKKGRNTIINK